VSTGSLGSVSGSGPKSADPDPTKKVRIGSATLVSVSRCFFCKTSDAEAKPHHLPKTRALNLANYFFVILRKPSRIRVIFSFQK
jgi:hypothetical protein